MLNMKKKAGSLNTTDTLIGEESHVEGNIVSQASLRIDGRITGDIECAGDLTLGEKAEIFSNVKARNIYNAGVIHGSITSKGMLNITNTGKVFGSITVSCLSIAEGGILQGTSKMSEVSKAKSEPTDFKPKLQKVEKTVAEA